MCSVSERLRAGKGVRNFDVQTTTKAGRVICLNISSIPLPSGKKGRYVVIHLFHEIKEIKTLLKIRRLTALLNEMVDGRVQPQSKKPEATEECVEKTERLRSLPLTKREREILCGLAEGMTTKALADHLYISHVTVRNHIQHILEKLGAHSRLEVLAMAFGPRSQ